MYNVYTYIVVTRGDCTPGMATISPVKCFLDYLPNLYVYVFGYMCV